MRVDLPAPLGPIMETISSASTDMESCRNISESPYPPVMLSTFSSGILPPKICFKYVFVAADFFRRAFHQLAPFAHDDHWIAQAHDHVHVVLDQQKCNAAFPGPVFDIGGDRKSTRLNSSH